MLEEDIKQYDNLQVYKYSIDQRLEYLSKKIKSALLSDEYKKDESTFIFLSKSVEAKVKLKNYTSYDNLALEQLLVDKGLWDECKKEVIDEDLVEQVYLEGKLTDEDLRDIRQPKYIPSLNVVRKYV